MSVGHAPSATSIGVPPDVTPTEVVEAVHQQDNPITIDQLTDEVLERAVGTPEEVGIRVWGDIHEYLYRRGLPELEAAGKLRFHRTRGIITPAADG